MGKTFRIVFAVVLLQFCLPLPSHAENKPLGAQVSTAKTRGSKSTFIVPVKTKSISAKASVSIQAGAFHFTVPGSGFRSAGKGKPQTFKGKAKALGVSAATLDPKAKTLTFTLLGVPLAEGNFPIAVSVQVGSATSCTMLGGKTKKSAGKKSLLLAPVGKCSLANERLSSSIGVLTAGEPAPMVFRLQLASAATQLAVYQSDASGAVGAKICTLSDDGSADSGDAQAGDNSFACKATLNAPKSGSAYYVAKGKRGGAITFPGISLPVLGAIGALGTADISTGTAAISEALAQWDALKSSLGDSDSSRLELLQRIMTLPGVSGAVLSPNGIDVQITLKSGLQMMLILNTRGAEPGSSSATAAGSSDELVSALANTVRERSAQNSRNAASTPVKVLLYDPGYFPGTENETLRTFMDGADPATVTFTDLKGGDATTNVTNLLSFTGYDVILIDTHGTLDGQGRVGFVMPFKDSLMADFLPYMQKGQVKLCGSDSVGPGIDHNCLLLMPDFISNLPGSFNGTTVLASACYSLANSSMADAFISKGAGGYVGYDSVVSAGYAADVAGQFLCSGIIEGLDNGQSFNLLEPKVDPSPVAKSDGGTYPLANVKYSGSTATHLGNGIEVDQITPKIDPSPLLLFQKEKYSQTVKIGAQKLPPCLKYRLKNGTPDILAASRLIPPNSSAPIDDTSFDTTSLIYTAAEKDGKADLVLYVVRDSTGKVIGSTDPKVEVVCKQPSFGNFTASQSPVNIGDNFTMTASPVEENGCNLFYLLQIFPKGEDGLSSLESNCGTPINATKGEDSTTGYPQWKATSLPIQFSTSGCTAATKTLHVIVQPFVAGKTFTQHRVDGGTKQILDIPLEKNDSLSGSFSIISATYTLPGYTGEIYAAEAAALITPDPTDVPNVTKFCVKVNPNGPYGYGGAYQYGGVDYENEETLRDFCADYGKAPGSGPCGNWMGSKLAIGNAWLIKNYPANDPDSLLCAFPGDPQICTVGGGVSYLQSQFGAYTFTARRRGSRGCNQS